MISQLQKITNIGSIDITPNLFNYNLLDLIMKTDKKKIKQHISICETFEGKYISTLCSDNLKTAKSFDIFQTCLIFFITNIIQIVHYECLNVNQYEDVLYKEDRKSVV